jgi:hypothetical protein
MLLGHSFISLSQLGGRRTCKKIFAPKRIEANLDLVRLIFVNRKSCFTKSLAEPTFRETCEKNFEGKLLFSERHHNFIEIEVHLTGRSHKVFSSLFFFAPRLMLHTLSRFRI